MKNIKTYSPAVPHLLQAQQALALVYAKVTGRPGTGGYPAPSPSPATINESCSYTLTSAILKVDVVCDRTDVNFRRLNDRVTWSPKQPMFFFFIYPAGARKIIYNSSSVRIENSVTRVTVRHHSESFVTPNSYPRDGIFNPHLTTIKGSYNVKLGHHIWKTFKSQVVKDFSFCHCCRLRRLAQYILNNSNLQSVHKSSGPRQANLCLRAFRHDKF